MNIMFALVQRSRTGRGCYLDIAMTDNLFSLMYWAMGDGLAAGQWPVTAARWYAAVHRVTDFIPQKMAMS